MTVLALAAAYVLGSVPFSALAARFKGVDLREHGSGNLGATNAIRVLGPGVGVPVLLADVFKGLLAAGWIPWLFGRPELGLACGGAAIAGHVWPLFLGFRGGKGVATAAGVFFAVAPAGTAVATGVFAVVLLVGRYVSLASMTAAVTLPFALWLTNASRGVLIAGIGIAVLVLVRHRSNVGRLATGTESRVRFGRSGR